MPDRRIRVSREQACNFFLRKQLLINPKLPKGKAGALQTIEKLGYVQIDTINVIERSHHIVFFTRCPDYQPYFLHELQAKDKKIFEYWAHAASFIPMADYRYYLRIMEKQAAPNSWLGKWVKENPGLIKKVKKRIVEEGPLTARDFEDVKLRKRGPWWDWKPAKTALEVLFWRGELMIRERRNFQRVYDLAERVLPKDLDVKKPSEDEEKRFFVNRALTALGIASEKNISNYIGISGKLNQWLYAMAKSREILKVEIEGIQKPYYVLAADLNKRQKTEMEGNLKVRFLSPFDNSIILRDRTKILFNFDYCLECYVTPKKRKYGYFCLPILWQSRLVGMIDPKANRQEKALIVNNLHLLDENLEFAQFMPAFALALKDFSRFHNCPKIEFNKRVPMKIQRAIMRCF